MAFITVRVYRVYRVYRLMTLFKLHPTCFLVLQLPVQVNNKSGNQDDPSILGINKSLYTTLFHHQMVAQNLKKTFKTTKKQSNTLAQHEDI